ncbi:MAG: GntR family transcriptional regulator [Ottowia sp.]|uniref:GntR family transcriptional regulator n=1 Tax=Ottowia sp. TaxID=1898956 RepID=UPI0039E53001
MPSSLASPQFVPGATALYAQLASLLRSRILGGEWAYGETIPSLQELSELYGLGRVTVRQALQILAEEGLISSQRGRRTFVTYAPGAGAGAGMEQPVVSYVAGVEQRQPDFNIVLLSRVRVAELPRGRWQVGRDEGPYVHIRKLDRDGELVYGLGSVHVAEDLYKRFPKGAESKQKLAQLVRKYAGSLSVARERITVLPTDFEAAAALDYPMAAPAARAERVVCDASGRVVYLAVSIYRGDRFGLERDLLDYFR